VERDVGMDIDADTDIGHRGRVAPAILDGDRDGTTTGGNPPACESTGRGRNGTERNGRMILQARFDGRFVPFALLVVFLVASRGRYVIACGLV
jgi:hypothetical protein